VTGDVYDPGVLWDVCVAAQGYVETVMPGVSTALGALGPRLDIDDHPVVGIGIEEEPIESLEAGGDSETMSAVIRIAGWAAFVDGQENLRTIIGLGRGLRHAVRLLVEDQEIADRVDMIHATGVRRTVTEWEEETLLYGATLRVTVQYTETYAEE
jgi:hypothetical protein